MFFALIKKSNLDQAKTMLKEKPLLYEFITQLNDKLYYSRYAFENVIMETFNFSYKRAKRVTFSLTEIGILTDKDNKHFIEKDKLKIFDGLL